MVSAVYLILLSVESLPHRPLYPDKYIIKLHIYFYEERNKDVEAFQNRYIKCDDNNQLFL